MFSKVLSSEQNPETTSQIRATSDVYDMEEVGATVEDKPMDAGRKEA